MSDLEKQQMIEWFGREPKDDFRNMKCGYLDKKTNKCRVYQVRPAICRLFGVVQTPRLLCPYGCTPFQFMGKQDSYIILNGIKGLK